MELISLRIIQIHFQSSIVRNDDLEGRIIRGIGGFYYVDAADGNEYECKARGVFRYNLEKPLPGDYCDIEIIDGEQKTGNITSIHDRTSELIRPAVANIDRAIICFAVKEPDPHLNLLDRFLINTMEQDIETVIVFNKTDLSSDLSEKLKTVYIDAGYETLLTSTITGEGLDELRELVKDRTSIVSGPSGVGKSSIMNFLYGSNIAEAGGLSDKIKRGKNTTRSTELVRFSNISEHTYIMDTPGFSSLRNDIDPDKLSLYYKEMEKLFGKCRFTGCVHIHEPGCAVKEAVEAGEIHIERYENYKLIYDELKKRRKW